ncbi:nitroreductase family deazaflavin-dependent oxidoreductase [Gordonia sp. HY442]|uniref:nitroreductase family deazaflavin-dependent oxidoreductase n=1 Tax=Gordonia zhenghanii TaxID=2911516 RepID=UPI001F2E6751|nr:nitroreductase family deazaflavin-dependent oxidoreductase [Gordonia zhenghanii]MCF8602795.1 nitroreductase family deazaflavin-dependent oxidoreductase [Gordonia zhenghanii]
MSTFARVARVVNTAVTPLLSAPVVGPLLGKSMTQISYTGRKSGKRFTLPVAFRRQADGTILVGVAAASQKTWWRNFQPGPTPITIDLDGVERTGTGVAKVGTKGTSVVVTLDDV